MIEKIAPGLCNGCGWCVLACPMEIIEMRDVFDGGRKRREAYFTNPRECVVCYNCERVCPEDAVTVYPEKPVPHP